VHLARLYLEVDAAQDRLAADACLQVPDLQYVRRPFVRLRA